MQKNRLPRQSDCSVIGCRRRLSSNLDVSLCRRVGDPMASYNKVILVGNLTRDPEVRYTTGGTAVCDITLAVNSQWTDKRSNERKEEVSFIDVTLWGRTAEIAGEYLAKGRPVLVEGRLQQDKWDDKETGQKRSKLKVVADGMQLLGSRPESGGRESGGREGGGRESSAREGGRDSNRGDSGSRYEGGNDSGQSGSRSGNPRPASPGRASSGYADADPATDRTPDQTFYDDMPSGGDEVPF